MKFREKVPVYKLSDQCTFLFVGASVLWRSSSFWHNFSYNFLLLLRYFSKWANLDECLMITKIEVSCWKEQLKQAVSPLQFISISYSSQSISIPSQVHCSNNYVSHYIPPFIKGFTETTLTPLQASTILLSADQRRAVLNPPLPLISHNQVQHGKLATLLTEEDYNLSTMVNLNFHFDYFALKVTSLLPSNFPFPFNILSMTWVHLYFHLIFTCGLVLHFHMGFYEISYIFCMKYFNAISHISSSSMVIFPHCKLVYAIIFLFPVEFCSRRTC